MKILVTGGSGLTGIAISRELIANNHQVTCIDLNPSDLEHPQYSYVAGDVLDQKLLSKVGEDCDAGIHLAVSKAHTTDTQMISENSTGAFSFFECARRNNFKTSVLVSSAPGHLPASSYDLSIDGLPNGADSYDLSKNLQEKIAHYFKTKGLHVLCLRIGHVVFGESARNLDTDDPLSEFSYCRGAWIALEDVGPVCAAALATPNLGDEFLFNAVGSKSGRSRFDVEKCERRFGTSLKYDFHEFESNGA